MPPTNAAEQAQILALAAQLSGAAPPPAAAPPAAPPAAPVTPPDNSAEVEAMRQGHERARLARDEAAEAIAEFFPEADEGPGDDAPEGDEGELPPAAVTPPPVGDDDPIAKYLEDAKAKRGSIHEAATRAEQIEQQAQANAKRIEEQARAEAREYLQRVLGLAVTNPDAAAQQLGISATEVIARAAEINDPQNQIKSWFQQELAKRDAVIEQLRADGTKRAQTEEQQARARKQEEWQRSQQAFVAQATPETFPACALYWGPERLLHEANREGQMIHEAAAALGMKPTFTDEQILARLEKRAREELAGERGSKLASFIQNLGKAPAAAKAEAPPADAKKTTARRPPARTLAPGLAAATTNPNPRAFVREVDPPAKSDSREADLRQKKQIARMLDKMRGKPAKSA